MKTLDIKDLRIGDYVTTNGKPTRAKKGEYYRITAIDSIVNLNNELIGAAVREDRENAIKAFRKVHCRMGIEIPCNRCSSTCKIKEFKKFLNE